MLLTPENLKQTNKNKKKKQNNYIQYLLIFEGKNLSNTTGTLYGFQPVLLTP